MTRPIFQHVFLPGADTSTLSFIGFDYKSEHAYRGTPRRRRSLKGLERNTPRRRFGIRVRP